MVREDGASEKKWQFFWTWAMKVLCEVTMCKKKDGEWGGKINPPVEFDMSGDTALEAEGLWSYNHEEFVPEVSAGGDGRGGGEASCGMRVHRLCGEGCCCKFRHRGGVTEMVTFAGFMKYGEKFEEKVQVVLRGVFVAKWKQRRRESW